MKYQGSKNRHAKHILPIILSDRKEGQLYIEPFVGGANLIDKVTGPRLGADLDADLISLWQAVSKGKFTPPKSFTEEEYKAIRCADTSPLRGYCAFALSYGGKKFGGWCRDRAGKRDYVAEAYRNAQRQFPKLVGVKFRCCSYLDLNIPDGSLVYCDPPYANTTKYSNDFDHNIFWDWAAHLSMRCTVYVSEYNAPHGWLPVWEKQVSSSLTQHTGSKKAAEKLFVYQAQAALSGKGE